MTTDRTRAERALAAVVHAIRADWDEQGVVVVLRRLSDRPMAQVAAAAIHCAAHRTDQQTPRVIELDGEHWRALDRMAGKAPTAEPDPKCPRHGQWLPCLACHAEQVTPATPEQIRARREQARTEEDR